MTVIKHKAQRVGIFIDTQNIYHSAKNLHHAKANFGQIVKDVLDGRVLIRAMAYVVTTESGEENAFFGALEKLFDLGSARGWDIDERATAQLRVRAHVCMNLRISEVRLQ